ncbi:uncharacterized protein LOC129946925 [Eupeodes corollae]|uniref:uncharacterized protein LOC129946925 n=1 Tax=Eupeodes corollae TaxID=290404 RepID=UPI002491A86F|nr:uncharacterized protein LOC129946925 [Eupeodes corollae]XP_055913282.1 uncharacterized protein LOC129946925 [Eupeodes corollae]
MFRNRTDRILDLINLHRRLEKSNMESLLDIPTTSISEDVEKIRSFLKSEIESFSTYIINGCLDLTGTIDMRFAEKVIEFDPNFFGDLLGKAISKSYSKIGFDPFLKIIAEIKDFTAALDGVEALFKQIIIDGEKHRTEACELTKKLEDITSGEDFSELSAEQMLRATNMIERLKPYARPIVRKIFNFEGMPLKEGEENGVSHPIFSRTGSWAEHALVMSLVANSFEDKQNKYKKALKK